MNPRGRTLLLLLLIPTPGIASGAEVTSERRTRNASADFNFDSVPAPSRDDAGTAATFTIIDGDADGNGASVAALRDGQLPGNFDDAATNFFFRAGTSGGRIGIDLGDVLDIVQVNTYSWHRDTRGPQVYKLYAADGTAKEFDGAPKAGVDPATRGWTLLASVDTQAKNAGADNGADEPGPGGQYAVSVASGAKDKPLGAFRHLLIDAASTRTDGPFGNTFFSEVDVVARSADGKVIKINRPPVEQTVKTTAAGEGGKYEITIDSTGLDPAMSAWAERVLRPVCEQWYPKIVEMLPSEGYEAPRRFTVVFRDDMGGTPAAAAGTRVMCNRRWFERNRDGEAAGAVVHEMVHVVQQYGRRRRDGADGGRAQVPFWLQEGIPDYIRWFLYEPEKRGAEVRDPARVKYDNAYRISANFLHWATGAHDAELVRKLNAAIRSGKYSDGMWKDLTGKTLDELDADWKAALDAKRQPAG